jgi:hypothetical protein
LKIRSAIATQPLAGHRPATQGTVYVAFACGRGFAGPDLSSIRAQIPEGGCSTQGSASASAVPASGQDHPYLNAAIGIVGSTLAAAAILGVAYFGYRAAAVSSEANNPVTCTTNQLGTTVWTTTCR